MQTLAKNSNRVDEKSTSNLCELMDDVLKRARAKGASDAVVSVNHDSGFSVDVRMNEVETLAFNEDKGLSLVVYLGNRKGAASTTDTTAAALDALVTAAYEIAEVSAADPCFGLPDKELMTHQHQDLELYHPWDINPKEAIEKALACEAYALSLDKRISNSDGVNFSTHAFCQGFANTAGGKGIIKSTVHSISCSFIAKKDDNMQRDYAYSTSRRPDFLEPAEQIAQRAVDRTTSRLDARQLKTQKVPVLFSSRVSSGLFSSFINAISGNNIYRKNSFLLDTIGEQIFPSGFKIYEEPYLLGALGSSPFDEEGVPTRNNILVEDGRLCQYVLNSYSARRLGLKTTANSGGVHNLMIQPSDGDLFALLAQMDKGLLVTELMGQGVNGLTGDYSRGASGFWVEGGQIQYPVEEITIAGNLKTMFKAIVAIGSDINPSISTRCGSVLIEEMMIAGQ